MHTLLHDVFPVADTVRMIVSATRLLLRCMVKYCKLLVQNSWWLVETCRGKSKWNKLREVYTLPVHLTINTPHTLDITALNMLDRTNGTVHSLTACSKDWPGFCQQLKWTSPTPINNQQQKVQVQCIKPTARAGPRRCKWVNRGGNLAALSDIFWLE